MKLTSVDHAQITIPPGCEASAREFYCGLLGLLEVEKPAALRGRGGFWLQLGGFQIHLGSEDGVDRSRTKAHLAYEVDDLEAWRSHLLGHGANLVESIPVEGLARFELRDPFGNRLELLQKFRHRL